jgi:cytochrome c oxidase subunit I
VAAITESAPSRVCNVTGFVIDRNGERLALANAVAGIGMLAFGGTLAILIALQRQVLPISDEWWYRMLAAHGATMLLFWLLLFEVAALYWGSTMLINAPMRAPKIAWANFGMMLVGILMAQWAMLTGRATVMFTAYPPLTAHPVYYAGVLLFAVGALVAIVLFFTNLVMARREGLQTGSLPLVVYGLAAAAIIGVYSLATGAVAYGMLFLQSIGLMENVDPATYRLFFWGIGHGAQQVNLAAMVAVWYALIGFTLGGRPVNEGLSRFAFLLYVAFIHLGAVHHLMVDPGTGMNHRIMNTSYMLYLAVLASLIHAFSIPAAIEVAQRERGHRRGLFGWLRRAPWSEPGFSALVLSVVFFGFIAGVSGVLMGTMQLNMIIHNTLFTVGHFHSTVVSGTTMAFMGISYYLVPLLSQRRLHSVKVAKWQPWVFSGGVLLLTLAMMLAGRLGVPRRVADLSYADAPVGVEQFATGPYPTMMLLVSIGAVFAVAGGIMFIWVMVMTLLRGEKTERPDQGLVWAFGAPERERVAARVAAGGSPGPASGPLLEPSGRFDRLTARWRNFEAPGTYAIVLLFLIWFIGLYVVSHIGLARLWPVG